MTKRLDGKAAIVTGASSGIGRATALALAREGARVALAGRTRSELDAAVATIRAEGAEAFAVPGDVRREPDVLALFREAAERLGALDILVNSAGVGYPGPAALGQAEEWREMLETNVLGPCLTCREAVRAMAGRGGTLVNVSALAGSEPSPGFAVYAASKHALNGFSATLRLELADAGIRVLVVEPGPTMTSFLRNVPHAQLVELGRALGLPDGAIPKFEGAHAPEPFLAAVARALPDRFLSAERVAGAILTALVAPAPGVEKITLRPGH